MIELVRQQGGYVELNLRGQLSREDLTTYYSSVRRAYRQHGRVHLRVNASNFIGYQDARAVLRLLVGEPTLLWRLHRYELHSNQRWLRHLVSTFGTLCFWIDVQTHRL